MTDQELIEKMAAFFLQESNNDYDKAREEICKLRLHVVEVLNDQSDPVARIVTERPGLLIGRRGERYNHLVEFLGMQISIIEHKGMMAENNLLSTISWFEYGYTEDEMYNDLLNDQI